MRSVIAINEETFSAKCESGPSPVVVRLTGNADMVVHDRLKVFLDGVHATARSSPRSEVLFDLTELYFMNSSCLSLFVRFINAVVELPASDRIRVRFRSNPNLRWQAKSLAALRGFAEDVVSVE